MQIFSELKEASQHLSVLVAKQRPKRFPSVRYTFPLNQKSDVRCFFENRKGILPQMYLGDLVQSPVFSERIPRLWRGCWKSGLCAAAPAGAHAAIPASSAPEPALAVPGRGLDKRGLCGSTELLSEPSWEGNEPKTPAQPQGASAGPRITGLLPSPGTAGKQSCHEPLQCNSQCNSLKRSLFCCP